MPLRQPRLSVDRRVPIRPSMEFWQGTPASLAVAIASRREVFSFDESPEISKKDARLALNHLRGRVHQTCQFVSHHSVGIIYLNLFTVANILENSSEDGK